jgi:hypothetical protein
MTTLERNLASLSRLNLSLPRRLEAESPSTAGVFQTKEGPGIEVDGLPMCSRVCPATEGEAIADDVDLRYDALICVLGYGAGYHVAALARKVGYAGLIVVLEPNTELLRLSLSTIDHSESFAKSGVVIMDGTENDGDFATLYRGGEGMFVIGVRILNHLPSMARLADAAPKWLAMVERCCDAVRCNLITCRYLAKRDVINRLGNAGDYACMVPEVCVAMSEAMQPAEHEMIVAGGPS